ncbi:uncharacterized protein LOC142229637 [Haematobia irritans]|uniref:uncharacterized protein LOC142229637 n=1 Tax=Haematobia irritans TaxID=7368 RepID=UPI003F505E0A
MESSKTFVLIFYVIFMTIKIATPFGQHTWTYEMKSVETKTSNPDLVQFYNLRVVRVDRGVYAMSGNTFFNVDIVEGDSNEIEVKTYRSEDGVKEYKLTPFSVPRQHFFDYMNKFYKEAAMETLSKCSDLPVFEDKLIPPIEKKNYTLTNCKYTQEGLPQYMQEGFYKIEMLVYGDCEWSVTYIVEVIWTS